MRDHAARRYFGTDHALVASKVERDLPQLVEAVLRVRAARNLDD